MSEGRVTVTRIYNNNVLLCSDGEHDVVVVGKGLGYAVRPGGQLDSLAPGLRRFVPDGQYRAAHVAELLSDATVEETEAASEIVDLANDALGMSAGQRLLLPLLDHLSFAVARAREGTEVDFPLMWETEQTFPSESAAGRRAVELVRHRLGVQLQEGEWSAFALHFVTYRWSGGDLSRTLSMARTITQAFTVLEEMWRRPIDQRSPSAARFVAHLRYLWARAIANAQLQGSPVDFMAPIRNAHPEAVAAAERLSGMLGEATGAALTDDEVAYIALHASRLYLDSHGAGEVGILD
jgi:beta-glucoside operon transcriptional antiterminator